MGGGGGGWALITVDDGGGGGGKNCQNIDYVICERPLTIKGYIKDTKLIITFIEFTIVVILKCFNLNKQE